MRVLHISSPKTWRGGEQQLLYLVEELNQIGVWQLVLCPFNSAVHKYCLKNHINHLTYFKGFSANPMVAFRINHICKREGIDLMHVHDSHAHNFAVLSTVLTKNTVPIIVSRRVDFPVKDTSMSFYKYNHPNIAKIICVSQAIADIMEKSIEDKVKLEVVHSGVDLNKFTNVPKVDIRKELGIDSEYALVGNVAALAPHKDYETFIATAKQIVGQGHKVKFLAIGDGPSRKQVEEEIAKNNLEDHVLLLGFRDDVVSLLPELDVFLITSKTEGLGTSILDAQVARIPIVATRAGGIVEIVKHEVNGLVADVADSKQLAAHVIRLLNDRTFAQKLVEAGADMVKSFSKGMTAQKTKAVYNRVLRGNAESE
jgi:glycosyltransferase involved in cell wall biosynthesis